MLPTRSIPGGLRAKVDKQCLPSGIGGKLASKVGIDWPVPVDARGI